ncbi:unnamed protein product, partial [Effrenium voratum]
DGIISPNIRKEFAWRMCRAICAWILVWQDSVTIVRGVQVPLLEAARWALSTGASSSCAQPGGAEFEVCPQPWAAVEAWQYACANLLAAEALGAGRWSHAASTAAAAGRFFVNPDRAAFAKVSEEAAALRRHMLEAELPLPKCTLDYPEVPGLGVPFPLVPVVISEPASLQLKGGAAMPLLALAVSGRSRPSVSDISQALRDGVRHLEVSPSVAHAVGQAIRESRVERSELFLSVLWQPPLDSAAKLQALADQLGPVDMMILPHALPFDAMRRA